MANVVVRVDASESIGTGHVMRCLSLVGGITKNDDRVYFLCASSPGNLADVIKDRGYEVTLLPENTVDCAAAAIESLGMSAIDLLIVDHYRIDARWESAMRSVAKAIFVIDDLADRDHDCDVLLDHNLREQAEQRYRARVPVFTELFLGPRFTPFREEFYAPGLNRRRDGQVKRLLVFPGGSDPTRETEKCIQAFRNLPEPRPAMDLVIGASNPRAKELMAELKDSDGISVYYAVQNMAELLAQADLAIGSCGIVSWERCALGLPAIVVVTADNQMESARLLQARGAVEYLGSSGEVDAAGIECAVAAYLVNPEKLRAMSISCQEVAGDWKRGAGLLRGRLRRFLDAHV